MLQSKECAHTSMKKCNNKSSDSHHFHHQTSSVNTVLNINELTNLSESVLKTKSVRAKSVKNVTDIVSNIVNTLTLLKQNSEMRQDEDEYCAQET